MEENIVPKSVDDSFLEKLKLMMSQGEVKSQSKPEEQVNYSSMWRKSLSAAETILALYGKMERGRPDKDQLARMIFHDIMDRQKAKDLTPKNQY